MTLLPVDLRTRPLRRAAPRVLAGAMIGVAVSGALGLGLAPGAGAAGATLATPAGPGAPAVGFSVGAPADPLAGTPGQHLTSWLLVSNLERGPITLDVSEVVLQTAGGGRFAVAETSDPQWAGGVSVPASVSLPAGGYTKVPVQLTVPRTMAPGVHLAGFMVEPPLVPVPGAVAVHGRIATYLAVEVGGASDARLWATWSHPPRFVVGDGYQAAAVVHQSGAATYYRAQARIDDAWGGTNQAVVQLTGADLRLLPAGATETLEVRYRSPWFSLTTPTVQLSWPHGNRMETSTLSGPTVLVVGWPVLATAGGVLAAALAWAGRLLLRRRRRRRGVIPACGPAPVV